MKMSLQTEQTIAGFILLLLLGCCIQEQAASQDRTLEERFEESLSEKSRNNPIDEPEKMRRESMDLLSSQDMQLEPSTIKSHIDPRFGHFKKAYYLPNSQSLRFYDESKLAVRNSVVEVIFDTPEGEKSTTIQKIDVYIQKNGEWVLRDQPLGGDFAKL